MRPDPIETLQRPTPTPTASARAALAPSYPYPYGPGGHRSYSPPRAAKSSGTQGGFGTGPTSKPTRPGWHATRLPHQVEADERLVHAAARLPAFLVSTPPKLPANFDANMEEILATADLSELRRLAVAAGLVASEVKLAAAGCLCAGTVPASSNTPLPPVAAEGCVTYLTSVCRYLRAQIRELRNPRRQL